MGGNCPVGYLPRQPPTAHCHLVNSRNNEQNHPRQELPSSNLFQNASPRMNVVSVKYISLPSKSIAFHNNVPRATAKQNISLIILPISTKPENFVKIGPVFSDVFAHAQALHRGHIFATNGTLVGISDQAIWRE